MSAISFKQLSSNIQSHIKTEAGYRVETLDGRYFDLDENAFNYIDVLVNKLKGKHDSSELNLKETSILKSFLKKDLLILDGVTKNIELKKPKRIILFREPSIRFVSKLFSFLIVNRLVIISLFLIAFTVIFYQLKYVSDLDALASISSLSPLGFLMVFLLFYAASIVHEFGHAVACAHLTGRCDEIGLKFNYIFPAFYCDVSPLLMEKSKSNKIVIGFSGVYFQILFTLCLIPFISYPEVFLFQAISLMLVVMNLYPFAKTDGYWMLCDFLGYKNFFIGVLTAYKESRIGYKDIIFLIIYFVTVCLLILLIVNGFKYAYSIVIEQSYNWVNFYRAFLFILQSIFVLLLTKELYTSIKSFRQSKVQLNNL
jgi:hypothetical protein